MLDIRVDNQSLDLGNVSITFELLSPVFNAIGSYSYPFTIPATEKNKRILGFRNRVNVFVTGEASFGCEVFLNNILWKCCKMTMNEFNNDIFKLFLVADEGYFYNNIKDVPLKQIDLGGERLIYDYIDLADLDEMFSNVYNNLYPNADFAIFPVANSIFYDEVPGLSGYQNYLNYWTALHKLNNDFQTIMVYPYVSYIIKCIASYFDHVFVKNDFGKVTELNQLCLHSNNPIMTYSYVNEVLHSYLPTYFNLQKVVPDILVTDLLRGLENTFAAYIFYNEQRKEVSLRLFNDIIEGLPDEFDFMHRINSIKQNTFEGYKVSWENDADDAAVETYSKGVSPHLNYRGAVATFDDMPATGDLNDYYYITWYASYWGYKVSSITGTITRTRISSYAEIISGKGTKSISPHACLTDWWTLPGVSDEHVFYEKMGNHLLNDNEYKETPLRFMFYRGMLNGQPWGGHFSAQRAYSLNWEGTTGLYEKFWRRPLEFLQRTREAEISAVMDPGFMKNIDFGKKYRIENANWLFSGIKFTVTRDRISPATITAYKV